MRHFSLRLTPIRFLFSLAFLGLGAIGLAGCGAKSQPVAAEPKKFLPADESQASATTEVAAAQSEGQAARRAAGQPEFAAANGSGRTSEPAGAGNTSAGTGKGAVAASPQVQQ